MVTKKQRAMIDTIAFVLIVGGFALYYIPTHRGGAVGWERVIPFGLAALYWVGREHLFRWFDRR